MRMRQREEDGIMKAGGWKRCWVPTVLLLMAVLSAACSSSGESTAGMNSAAPAPAMEGGAAEAARPEAASVQYDAASASDSAQGSGGSANSQANGGFGGTVPSVSETPAQMLIYKANLTMEVESYTDTYTAVQNAIHLSNGYIVQFSEQSSHAERAGVFAVKVPAEGFNGFLQTIEDIPHLSFNRSMSAQDVSEEYVDLESRLKAKQVVETRLLAFMEQAKETDSLVKFSNELASVQEEIERLKGRMRYLEANVAYSTVELRVYEKLNPLSAQSDTIHAGLADRMGKALQASLRVMAIVAEGVMIFIAGAIPVLAVSGLIGAPVYWWVRRKKRNTPKSDL